MRQPLFHKKNYRIFFWAGLALFLLFGVTQISATPLNARLTPLIINEFMATNGSGLTDEDGDYADWIEIYNQSNRPVNLAGWALTNDPNQPAKWGFPDMTLGSHNYLVVFASGKNRTEIEPGAALHANFRLNKRGDFLGLYNVLEDRFMDEIAPGYPAQFQNVAYGRYDQALTYGYLATATPGGPNDETLAWADVVAPVVFSLERGFYEQPFSLTLSSVTPEAVIRYTTDGSQPTTGHGAIYSGPITIESTTVVRAAAFKPTMLPSPAIAQSYIFLDDILAQPANPAGFPTSWGARLAESPERIEVAAIAADYAMDPELANDSGYQERLKAALQAMPTLSLTLDRHSFADLQSNLKESGQAAERPVSVEYIGLTGEPGFQINAGIRPYLDSSQEHLSPKRSFRLLFKGDYGATKLEYPLFPDSPAQEFDTLLLLAGNGDNFAAPGSTKEATYLRHQWLRASQVAMSGLGSHGRFAHVYLNGLYWGVYNLAERPDDAFLASYLGGDKEDWFVLNQAGPLDRDLAAEAGRIETLFALLDLATRAGNSPEQQKLLADLYAEAATYIDPLQFSDYLILNWYAGLEQGPANRWYAGFRPQDIAGRGRFFIWDGAAIFQQNGAKIGLGQDGPTQAGLIEPLFETLLQDDDFRMQLADRLYRQLFNDGPLNDAQAQTRWLELSQSIDQAIIGEAARWGDANRAAPLSRTDWLISQEAVLAQMEGNAARLIALAREAGYYPAIDPPGFSQDGGLVEAGFSLAIDLPDNCPDCAIYYTTNGSDPRLPITGDLISSAMIYEGPITLSANATVKARALRGNPASVSAESVTEPTWSALHEATFNVVEQDTHLRLTEIMYNPSAGDDYEFIELKNSGRSALDLSGMFIDEGIRFIFPPDTPPLGPGEFAVLVSNPEKFAEKYPDVPIIGTYEGRLSNKGEKISLKDAAGQIFLEFEYNDENSWPVSADGRGDSLILVNEDGDPNDSRNWRASSQLGGSPGFMTHNDR